MIFVLIDDEIDKFMRNYNPDNDYNFQVIRNTGFARLTGNSQICGKNLNFGEFRGNIFKFRGVFISTLVDLVQKAVIYI